jgi:hypothetical protein
MSVDFPAPLGPIIPTRLRASLASPHHIEKTPNLDNDSAQLTSIKLGVGLPG